MSSLLLGPASMFQRRCYVLVQTSFWKQIWTQKLHGVGYGHKV